MAKDILFDQEAKDKILEGATIVKNAVAATLGPRGNNVVIEYPHGLVPRVVHDGVTVAKEVDLEDKFMDQGAQLMKDAASRTNNSAGDGTTTAIILAHAILQESFKNIAAGSNAMMLRRGIEKAVSALNERLLDMAVKVDTKEQKAQVATISAQDPNIGELIVAALEKVGKEGVVTVERGSTADIEVEYKEGMQFDKGWISPYFVTNQATMEASVEDVPILVTSRVVGNMQELLPLVQQVIDVNKINRLVVIATNVIGEVLGTLALNSVKGVMQSIAIAAPGAGEQRDAILEDIAVLTGATFVNEGLGKSFNQLTMEDLGRAQRVTASRDQTIIVGGKGKRKDIEDRIKYLRGQIERTDISEYQIEQYKNRLAKMAAGVAVINVGANSEAEADEKRERVIDAVAATKAAIDEGIVPGGETSFLLAAAALDDLEADSPEEATGIAIVRKAIEYPFKRLMENSGLDPGKELAKLEGSSYKKGINVVTGKSVDLIADGVIDPVKVSRSALENAASTAIMLMTSNVIIVSKKEQQNGQQFQPPGFPAVAG